MKKSKRAKEKKLTRWNLTRKRLSLCRLYGSDQSWKDFPLLDELRFLNEVNKTFFSSLRSHAHHCCEWICAPLKLKNNILAEKSPLALFQFEFSPFSCYIFYHRRRSCKSRLSSWLPGICLFNERDAPYLFIFFILISVSFLLSVRYYPQADRRKYSIHSEQKRRDEQFQHSSCSRWE